MRAALLSMLLLPMSMTLAQVDSIVIDMGNGISKSYALENVLEVSFIGQATDVREQTTMQELARVFALPQNYPNPFNPSTTISFVLPHDGMVHVEIYDITGRLVDRPLQQHLREGPQSVRWYGKNRTGEALPSGVYLCAVTFDGQVLVKKLTLIK